MLSNDSLIFDNATTQAMDGEVCARAINCMCAHILCADVRMSALTLECSNGARCRSDLPLYF